MKLSEIQDNWEKDCIINESNLGEAAITSPTLHSKYLRVLTNTKLRLRKSESDYLRLRKIKYRYFRGEMTKEELEKQGWNQYQGTKPIKSEMEEFLSTDDDLINLEDTIEYYKTVIYELESIMKSIHSRTWDIKNAIEWNKIQNGII